MKSHKIAVACCVLAGPWQVTEVLNGLDASGRHVLPVFITIDPERDTQERMKQYFEDHDFHKRIIALTGSHEALQAHAALQFPFPWCLSHAWHTCIAENLSRLPRLLHASHARGGSPR